MYAHVLYVLHIVQDSLTSICAGMEEFAPEWKLQGWFLSSYTDTHIIYML